MVISDANLPNGALPSRWLGRPVLRAYGTMLLFGPTAAGFLCVALRSPQGGHVATLTAAIFVASVVSSVAGFAFSALAGAMLFHLIGDPVQAVTIMLVCSIANQALMSWSLRQHLDWTDLPLYLVSGAFGAPLGVEVLLHADRASYSFAVGCLLLFYGGVMLMRRPIVLLRPYPVVDVAAAFVGGIASGAMGFPSIALSTWCGMKGWDKMRQRAVIQPFILSMQLISLVTLSLLQQASLGIHGFQPHMLALLPASLFGTALGLALFRRLNDRQFGRFVIIMLLVSGLTYVF